MNPMKRSAIWAALAMALPGLPGLAAPATAQAPDDADALMETALAAFRAQDWPAAAAALENLVAIEERRRGPDHAVTLDMMQNWGNALNLARDGAAAEPVWRAVVDRRRRGGTLESEAGANSVQGLAQALEMQGRMQDALPPYAEAARIREKVLGPSAELTALAFNNHATALGRAGRFDEALAAIDRAIRAYAALAGTDSDPVAAARANRGAILANMGRYPEAEAEHRALLASRTRRLGPDHPDVAASHNALGLALLQQGRLDDAEAALRKGLAIRDRALAADRPERAESLGNLASLIQARGRASEAEPLFRQAHGILSRAFGPDHPNTLVAENNLATVLVDLARLDEALPLAERQLALSTRLLGPAHKDTAIATNNLATILEAMGREVEAEALHRKLLAGMQDALGDNADLQAAVTNNLGHNLQLQGRFREAEELHRKALDLRRTQLGPRHPDVVDSLANVALTLDAQRRFDEATPLFEQAVALATQLHGREALKTASALNSLASNLDNRGRHDEAAPLYAQAHAIRLAALGERHPLTLTALNNIGFSQNVRGRAAEAATTLGRALALARTAYGADSAALVTPLNNLASVLMKDPARLDEALALARESAAIAVRRRAAILSGAAAGSEAGAQVALRARGAGIVADDPTVTAYIALTQVNHALAAQRPAQAEAMRAEAFVAAQAIDVSQAGIAMAQTVARAAAGGGELGRLVSEQQRLAAAAAAADAAAVAAIARNDRQAATEAQARAAALVAQLGTLDARIDRQFPGYRALVTPGALTIAQVQARLGPDEALLYMQPSNGDMLVFAVSRDSTAWHRAPDRQLALAREVETLVCQLDAGSCRPEKALPEAARALAQGDDRFGRAIAHGIYRDLVAPVEAVLAGRDRLYATINGPLGRLPLTLLVTAEPQGDDSDPQALAQTAWLADRHAVTALPSVASLAALDSLRPRSRGGAAFRGYGAPRFGPSAQPGAARNLARGVFRGVAGGGGLADPSLLRTLAPLPGTRTELEAMAATLSAPMTALRLDLAATEAALRSDPALGTARVIALATHGLLPDEIAGIDEPGLVFTPPASASAADDGVLTASEVSGLTLDADWVILSACNTAAAENGGPGINALSRAFLFAGARTLLASHWRVSDAATAALTVETLRAGGGGTRAQALQAAMRAVRTGRRADGSTLPGWQPDWAHPFAWAPFSLIASRDR